MQREARWSFLVLALGVAAMLVGCTTNPTTGRKQFNLISPSEEIAMGLEAKPQLVQEFGGEVAREDLRQYVAEVGSRLTRHTEGDAPKLPWSFTLLDSDVINAFALPGGQVFITRGLASKMTCEAQLAGVLGHEIGHVTARHTLDRMNQSLLVTVAAITTAVALEIGDADTSIKVAAPLAVQLGGQMVVLQYSRSQESESDALGVRYMVREGYLPSAQIEVMTILQDAMKGGRAPEFFSTHPYPETRIDRLTKLIDKDYPQTKNNDQFRRGDAEFRSRFLSKLALAYPNAGEARPARSVGELEVLVASAVGSRPLPDPCCAD